MSDAPDTDATLRALARLRADQDEAHRAAQAAGDDPRFAPPDEAEQADFLAALLGAPAAAEPTPTTAAAPAAVLPFPKRPAPHAWRWAVPAALAAGVLTFVATRRPEPLPAYGLSALQAGAQALRAEGAPTSWSMVPGTRFDLVLKPATPVAKPLHLSAFVATGDTLAPFTPEIEADAGGAFRIRGVAGESFIAAPGEHAFLFALTTDPAPVDAATVRAARSRPDAAADLRLIEHPFHVPAAAPGGGLTP